MPIDITDRLIKEGTDHAELQAMLGTLGDSSSEDEVVDYGDLIRVHFAKDGETIVKAEWLGAPSLQQFDHLEKKFDEALFGESETEIATTIMFTSDPITTAFKLGNDVQILPMPSGSVSVPEFCTRWPAIVEYAYLGSPDDYVAHFRRAKRRNEVLEFLNVCAGPYVWLEPKSDHLWVWSDRPLREHPHSEWRQSGFAYFKHWDKKDSEGFSEVSAGQVHDFGSRRSFNFPADLEANWTAWSRISTSNRKKFHIASHWYHIAQNSWSVSFTVAFSALAVAIDVLLPSPETTTCNTCNQQRGPGLNKRYTDFLSEYCPGLGAGTIREFARRRSKYVHGGGIMSLDEPRSFGLQPVFRRDQNLLGAMFEVCRVATMNWMISKARPQKV